MKLRGVVRRGLVVGLTASVVAAMAAVSPSVAVPAPGVPVTVATKVKDLIPEQAIVTSISGADDRVYFSADAPTTGEELWVSDGTTEGTHLVKDIWPGPSDLNTFPPTGSGLGFAGLNENGAGPLDGIFYFVGDDGVHGPTLWRSDGTEAGTSMVKDVVPSNTTGFEVRGLIVAGDELYFGVTVGDLGQLWKSDGTTAGTVKVADTGSQAYRITEFGAGVVFAVGGTVANGEMWVSDGTAAGTGPLGGSAGPFEITVAGGYAYWNGLYKQVWRTDGTPGGTQRVTDDVRAGETVDIIDGLNAVGDTWVYNVEYVPGTPGQRYELRRVSGSSPAVLVRDFDSETGGNLTDSTLASGGFLYFIPKPVPGNRYPAYALWRSDGTTAGTMQISSRRVNFLAEAAGRVFVTTYDLDQGQWSLNEVGSGGVAASSIAGPFAFPFEDATYVNPALTVVGDTTYFLAEGGLWKIGDDLTDPDTAITDGFAQDQVVTSYNFSARLFTAAAFDDFTTTDGASYEWRVDGGPWEMTGKDFGFPVRINGQPNEGEHTVSVRAIDAAGRTDPTPATRSFTIDLVAPAPLVALSDPQILGTRAVGQTLHVKGADWSSSPTTSTYQWLRNGTAIAGATSAAYQVVLADAGARLTVRERATSPTEMPGTATSPAVGIAKIATTTTLKVAKKTIRKGSRAVAVVTVVPAARVSTSGLVTIRAGKTKVGTAKASRDGVRVRLALLKPGSYQLTATYSGNSRVAGSKSTTVRLVVVR